MKYNKEKFELRSRKSKVLSILDYADYPNELMPVKLKELNEQYENHLKTKKEFGYSGLSITMSELTKMKETLEEFKTEVSTLKEKIEFYLENDKLSDIEKIGKLESLEEVLRVKNNSVKEKSIRQSNVEMNFNLNQLKTKCNVNLEEDRQLIEKIDSLQEKENNKMKNKLKQ